MIEPHATVGGQAPRFLRHDRHQELRWLALSDRLREEPSRTASHVIALSAALIVVLGLSAVAVPIAITVTGSAKIVGELGERVVSAQSNSTVERVFVDLGARVDAGSPIAELRDNALASDIEETIARRDAVERTVTRLRSLLAEASAAGTQMFNKPWAGQELLGPERTTILQAQIDAFSQRRTIVQADIAAQHEILVGLERSLSALYGQLSVVDRQVHIRRELEARGAGTLLSRLEAEQVRRQLARDLAETAGRLGEARQALIGTRARLSALDMDSRSDRGESLDVQLGELEVLEARLRGLQLALRANTVTSPLHGEIKTLIAREGETVRAGDPIAVVVPSEGTLRVEMKLPARMAPLVHANMPAKITIDGLDPYRFGKLVGVVRDVSASTFEEPNEPPVFRVRIDITEGASTLHRIRIGLTGRADIVVGQRTVLEYLANSLIRIWETSLNEP